MFLSGKIGVAGVFFWGSLVFCWRAGDLPARINRRRHGKCTIGSVNCLGKRKQAGKFCRAGCLLRNGAASPGKPGIEIFPVTRLAVGNFFPVGGGENDFFAALGPLPVWQRLDN